MSCLAKWEKSLELLSSRKDTTSCHEFLPWGQTDPFGGGWYWASSSCLDLLVQVLWQIPMTKCVECLPALWFCSHLRPWSLGFEDEVKGKSDAIKPCCHLVLLRTRFGQVGAFFSLGHQDHVRGLYSPHDHYVPLCAPVTLCWCRWQGTIQRPDWVLMTMPYTMHT